ncbi:hypothetical protein B9Z51_09005 [Limnohabitans sp. T6-5]|uniref:hypothetical protein n=1 Tax=Limnohabitans sp. T6-5 TaxID=1100724 RepID=UPI000D3C6111|nr:hypothetical protein [Limnohabitans sp. T6-5]PUE09053.1 hypothetical protein B9Z51_09005 [Limnohabitans sp. T6-5]
MKTLLKKIQNNALDLASKDRVTTPTALNLLASVGCSVLVLAWAYWVGHVGLGIWEGHSFFYKGHEYTADQAPLRAWLMLVGSVALSAFSVWAALQYALEAWWRVRRWHGAPAWPLGSTCLLSSRPVLDAVRQPLG